MTERPGTVTDQVEMTEQIDAFNHYYHAHVLAVENSTYESIYVWVLFVGILLIVGLVLIVAAPQLRAQNEQLYALGASTSLVRQIGGYHGASPPFWALASNYPGPYCGAAANRFQRAGHQR